MGRLAAALFSRVQRAPFYEHVHGQAAALLPTGGGRRWVDVGCGPGLLARLAAWRDYTVTAVDRDPAMIAAAERSPLNRSLQHTNRLRFQVAALEDLAAEGARGAVVSAASLLAVADDRVRMVKDLLALLEDGGTLLLVEPTAAMTLRRALRLPWEQGGGWRLVWAATRRAGRAVKRAELEHAVSAAPAPAEGACWRVDGMPLLGGMVMAWVIRASAV